MPIDKEQLYRQIDVGVQFNAIREERKIKLTKAASDLGISHAYLSEIEKGSRLPSDELIRTIARYYDLDEDDLFNRYGKVPLLAREQLEDMPGLQKVLSDIRKQKGITEERRQSMLDEVMKLYRDFLEEIKKQDDDLE